MEQNLDGNTPLHILLQTEHKNPSMLLTSLGIAMNATLVANKEGKYPYELVSPKDHPCHFRLVTFTTAFAATLKGDQEFAIKAMRSLDANGFSQTLNSTLEEMRKEFKLHFNL
jgi:hypothetical protein